jgi:hypothetical protein
MALLRDNRLEDARAYWLSPKGMGGITMVWHAMEKVRRGEISPLDAESDVGLMAKEKQITEIEQRLGVMA